MTKVHYGNTHIDLEENETVLQALLRTGIETPYSCETGNCQTCMLQSDTPNLPARSQATLIGKLRSQGYFLPCVCRPSEDINIINGTTQNIFQPVTVLNKFHYNNIICRLRLSKPKDFTYRPGQFINVRLQSNQNLVRSYSLSSVSNTDDFLEIQVRHKKNGELSRLLVDEICEGQTLEIMGPNGNCFYQSTIDTPLLLIATNTGIAPIYGIVREALAQQHRAPISIYYGSRNHKGLYLLDDLMALANDTTNLSVVATLSGEEQEIIANNEEIIAGRANEIAFKNMTNLKDFDLYICGNADFVKSAQTQGFLAGIAMNRIFIDPFQHKNLRQNR